MKWRAYPVYRDSGVEWLGDIPSHWHSKRLKYCTTRINEKVDGRESDLPYTGLEHIESWTGRLIPSEETPTSDGQSSRFKPGDVLFGKLRPYLAKVLRATTDGICTGELLVLRPNHVTRDYLFNYMLARDFITIVDSSTYGAKMPRASWEFIGNLPVLLPSENEQCAIAAFLDRKTAHIDALIAKKERQIELLQEKRAALISHAVTKGLDHTVPMKDSGIEWLGEIPAHWEMKRLKHVISSVTSGSRGWARYYSDSGDVFLRMGNLNRDSIDLDLSEIQHVRPPSGTEGERTQVRPNDILISITAYVGTVLCRTDWGKHMLINTQHCYALGTSRCRIHLSRTLKVQ